jgi:hypothetical protein
MEGTAKDTDDTSSQVVTRNAPGIERIKGLWTPLVSNYLHPLGKGMIPLIGATAVDCPVQANEWL